ncbi:MAG: SCO family protein [Candidatus Thiodiazotropha weberae]|nr:SCO family protein [Candidatus Thiodiazotropha lotti]MCG8010593.1 SCO family protein [Candidatus Thiodiazotropha lotti]MCG8019940.1 SCO family protein [Candidatus Thiodiazotropha lotti]MCW4207102.1 SCO family protein [Candidatus Thiodiazotropha lotti]MCW4210053.1 SCO family protein [Candidatus Thiodiazotropha lotti]
MSNIEKYPLIPLLVLLIAVFWPLTGGAAEDQDEFRVVVTIKPLHSIVAGLMVGVGRPELLIDDSQLPHQFTPSPDQRLRMQQADLLFWVGPELEASLVETIRQLGSNTEVIELLSHSGLKVLPSRHQPQQRDPHFWLDNRNLMIMLNDLASLLQQMDAKRAHVYERNRQTVLARLARIDREYEYGYRGMKAGLGIQYHDTLQYFEQAYALKVLDWLTGLPTQHADAKGLLRVRERIVAGEAVCLLSELGFPNQHLALLTQESDINHGILNSFGIGLPPGPDLYFTLMEHNTDEIKRCLNADMVRAKQARSAAQQERLHTTEGIGRGTFLLTDHLGRLVSNESMLGKFAVVYFGYTYCPDICPTSLQILFQALNELGAKSDHFQPYFITIDPQRDTVAVMKNYVEYYDERLIGVTGSPEMIERVASQFKARYERVEEASGGAGLYLMDHTASLYLLDPQGRFITKFAHGISPVELAAKMRDLLE